MMLLDVHGNLGKGCLHMMWKDFFFGGVTSSKLFLHNSSRHNKLGLNDANRCTWALKQMLLACDVYHR